MIDTLFRWTLLVIAVGGVVQIVVHYLPLALRLTRWTWLAWCVVALDLVTVAMLLFFVGICAGVVNLH